MRRRVRPAGRTPRAGRPAITLLALGGAMLLAAVLAGPAVAQEGIEINGGDRYTRSADVTVTSNPPPGHTHVVLHNDPDQFDRQGGLQNSQPVNRPIDWNLLFGVDDRDGLRTVYARFLDRQSRDSRTYSAQIVLDRARPRVLLGGVRSRGSLHQVALNAVDEASGVLAMQLAAGPGRISGWARFSPLFVMRMAWAPRYVRVLDHARNPGRWTRLRRGPVRQVVITPTSRESVRGTPNAWVALGAFRPAKGAEVIDAARAYGRPDRWGENRFGSCDIRWIREGLHAMATSFGITGQTACRADHGVQGIDFRGLDAYRYGWRTDRGLRIGDTLTKLRRLYPGASLNQRGEWELVSVDTGIGTGPAPILRAVTTSGGRVSELRTSIGGAGD